MKSPLLLALLWLVTCLVPAVTHAADVQATLDRTRVALGETVTLNLRLNGTGMVQTPDLGVLSHDFAVLGTSSNSSISIVNGQRTAQVTLGVALRPLHVGTLRIPPLSFGGGTTAPLQLEVVEPDPQDAAAGRQDVFLEATVEPSAGYVGQQLVYTLRLYFVASLTNGALEDPQLAGVDVRRLGNETTYQAERGGRRYNVVERRYALTPQREGHLEIPPVPFQGEMVDMADVNAFFGNAAPVSASSPAVPIDVRAVPAQAAHAAWLPARDLQLKLDGGPTHGDLRVGQPLNLVMTVQATGLPYEALPALSLPALEGATVYPDKPANGTSDDGHWLVGHRQQGFAIVPSRAGTLAIPETTMTWWNVVTNRAEVARIPAQSLTVLPALGAPAAPAIAPPAVSAAPSPAPAAPASPARPAPPWRLIALGSLALWLASLLAWLGWRWRRGRAAPRASTAPPEPASPSRLRTDFLATTRGTDIAMQARSLLAWARAERPELPNLGEVSRALASESQRDAIEALQRGQYAGTREQLPGERLQAAFRDGFDWRRDGEAGQPSPLAPLYPFNLER
ncbi:BatD family protein [Dyella soli]|uniref:Protein BatD n=1 Tax=Dyella soli TaxID=522319 RepID=A0A4R0YFT1_9GAMM|nr:BatD family protein [Dyella soli]TCI07106.1 protein BatD [Dyella soli]